MLQYLLKASLLPRLCSSIHFDFVI